jgi:hypothetical protein
MSKENKAETRDNPLTGSDETYSLDVETVKKRQEQRRKKLLQAQEVEADAYTPSKDDKNTDFYTTANADGHKRAQDVEKEEYIEGDSYPFEQENARKKPKRAEKVESEEQKSPLNK